MVAIKYKILGIVNWINFFVFIEKAILKTHVLESLFNNVIGFQG